MIRKFYKYLKVKGQLSTVNGQSAFTLIETLIYVAIIGIAVSSFVAFSISIANSRSKTYVVQEVQANARVAFEIMSHKIRTSTGVNIGASTFGTDPGVLSLSMADAAKNPTVFDLTQDDGQLQITEGVTSAVSLVSDEVNITNLQFTNLTGSGTRENIRIEMTVSYNNTGTDIEYTYSETVQTAVSVRQ